MRMETLSLALFSAALAGCPASDSAMDQGTKCVASTPVTLLYEAPCPMGSSYMRCYQDHSPGFY